MGSKGIPHSTNLNLNRYLDALYSKGSHYVKLRSLRLNKDRTMTRITQTKSGLSDIFVKFPLDSDGVTCLPLRKNGTYLYKINILIFSMWHESEFKALEKLYEYDGPRYVLNTV